MTLTTLCLKNDTVVAHYHFNAQLTNFRNYWQRCCWESILANSDCYFTYPN